MHRNTSFDLINESKFIIELNQYEFLQDIFLSEIKFFVIKSTLIKEFSTSNCYNFISNFQIARQFVIGAVMFPSLNLGWKCDIKRDQYNLLTIDYNMYFLIYISRILFVKIWKNSFGFHEGYIKQRKEGID